MSGELGNDNACFIGAAELRIVSVSREGGAEGRRGSHRLPPSVDVEKCCMPTIIMASSWYHRRAQRLFRRERWYFGAGFTSKAMVVNGCPIIHTVVASVMTAAVCPNIPVRLVVT